ncbi:MAG: DUF4783 domain-containing protein [Bacteroidota bacterium]
MKLFKLILLFISVNCFATIVDLYDDLASAIRAGDAHQVAVYFDSKVDLALASQEDVYSKAQAELLIKDFFAKNQPKSFSLVHKGSSKEGSLFAVGTLSCMNGKSFRVSFVMKSVKGVNSIQELRFENQ